MNPETFKISLLPHQKASIKAMLDLEQKREILIETNGEKCLLETGVGVLTDQLGSGKTLTILGLIEWGKKFKLKKCSTITTTSILNNSLSSHWLQSYASIRPTEYLLDCLGSAIEIRRKYKKFIDTNLIFVGKSVLSQWKKTISEYTKLQVLTLENINHIIVFYKAIFEPTNDNNIKHINKYDIILVKNGSISGKFEFKTITDKNLKKSKVKSILTLFGDLFKTFCFERVILDDFDTLDIKHGSFAIPSLFTWFVSSTKRIRQSNVAYAPKSALDLITNTRDTYLNIYRSPMTLTYTSIGSSNKFIDFSTKPSIIVYYKYVFKNPNENFIKFLGSMRTTDTMNVVEALNGDAINTAANSVGLVTNNVCDIFQKILGSKWKLYKYTLDVELYIKELMEHIDTLPICDNFDNSDDYKKYTSNFFINLKKNVKNIGPRKFIDDNVDHSEAELIEYVNEHKYDNSVIKDENGKAIQRVKDNIKEGECPISCEPLNECDEVVILKCCGIVISAEAASWSLKLKKTTITNAKDISGSCPNCRNNVTYNQLIILNDEMNCSNMLDNIMKDNLVVEEKEKNNDKNAEEPLNKYNCIPVIISQSEKLEDIKKTMSNVKISNLLNGDYDKGYADNDAVKCLIYAGFNETTEMIIAELEKNKILYKTIIGTSKQIDESVRRYHLPNSHEDSLKVLIITGPKYCAGLNLQISTDLIFAHRIADKNIESQVAGRAARIGRSNNLRIHYILYGNEEH